jgi:SET domain-containing protein
MLSRGRAYNRRLHARMHAHARAYDSMYPMTKSPQEPTATATAPRRNGRRVQVRRSGVHGKGVFALMPIRAGETVIEYTGEVITWKEALRRHPHDPAQPTHTFYFHIDDKRVIDANVGGNAARWINHACETNCEADEQGGRVFIKALRDIAPGEELFYDYGLVIDQRLTPKLKKEYPCHCGSARCRGTLLAPKRR